MKALSFIAPQQPEKVALTLGFDSFSDDSEAQAMRQTNHRHDRRGVARIRRGANHERSIQLHRVDVQMFQIAQRRIASAKIINRNLDAHSSQIRQQSDRGLEVFNDGRLSDFQLNALGIEARSAKHPYEY